MLFHEDETHSPLAKSDPAGNSYFGNPYSLEHEQFGLEHLDRHAPGPDEIESVVILGYN